jgi:hypothetical protein
MLCEKKHNTSEDFIPLVGCQFTNHGQERESYNGNRERKLISAPLPTSGGQKWLPVAL